MRRLLQLAFLLLLATGALAQQGNTITIGFTGAPAGSCSTIMYAINTANGDFYDCLTGAWNKVTSAGGAGTVTSIATTSPITGGTITTTGTIACATCTTAAAALTSNAVVLGGGSQASKVDTALSTDAAGAMTDTQGTITTSKPLMSHTVTWNAGGVVFTNWLSNVTCTAAAAASIAAGLGVAGTTWQFSFKGANCAGPQLLLPAGTVTQPSFCLVSTNNTCLYSTAGAWHLSDNTNTVINLNNATSGVNSGVLILSGAGYNWSASASSISGVDTGITRPAAKVVAVGDATAANKTGFIQSGMSVFVTSNFTTSGVGTALENITGLTWTFPALAANWSFHCHIGYSQAVGTAAVAFGIKASTNNPTNIFATGEMYTAAGTVTTGVLATLATQTATNIVTGTPGGTGTNLPVDLYGTLELPASAVTINLMTSTATAADTVTVLRGSYCSLTP